MNEESDLERFAPGIVIFLVLVGGFLRVLLLGTKGMWLDETFSVWIANHTVPEMLQWIIRIDQHPPLYYLLLHYWIAHYGAEPYYARLLSAIFGTVTIPVVFMIGKRMSGALVGLVAAVFMTFSPFNIYYAQETRMYTLLTFNAAVAIYALARLLTDPRSIEPIGSQFRNYLHAWRTLGPIEPDKEKEFSYMVEAPRTGWRAWVYRHRWSPIQTIETDLAWIAFIVFTTLTLLSHNTAVFLPIATNIFVLGLILYQRLSRPGSQTTLQAPSFWNWVKAQFGIFLLWSPWLLTFIQQARRVDQEFWIPKPTWEIFTNTLRTLLNASAQNSISTIMTWLLCAVLLLGLVYYRKKLSMFFFLLALFATPILGELIVSIRRPIFFDRTLIWVTIPLFIVLAAGIVQLRFRPLMIVMVGIFATNYLSSTGDMYRFVQKEDWNTAAGYVANFAQKDDLVLFNSNFVVVPFNYYFEPYEKKYAIQVIKQGVPFDLFDSGVMEPRMKESDIPALTSLLHGHRRVWLVYSHADITDPKGLIPQTIASQMKLTREREFYGGCVQLYEAP
ncbi:MAG: glycosyltransferase family 39 protein [Anaerolineales bacterium]